MTIRIKPSLTAFTNADEAGILKKYPGPFGYECVVVVNDDDYMPSPRFGFELTSLKTVLPKRVIIYGKRDADDDVIYLNYSLPVFAKTVEKGWIEPYQPEKWGSDVLCVGLPRSYRQRYINGIPANVRDFAIALFGGKARGVVFRRLLTVID